jgi:hypothetical protein
VISGGGAVKGQSLKSGTVPYRKNLASNAAPSWLRDALQDLQGVANDAEEMGYPPPTTSSLLNAESFLRRLRRTISDAPDVYSTPAGGVAVDFRNQTMSAGVLFVFEPDGQATWTLQVAEKRGRSRIFDGTNVLESGGLFALRSASICG